MVKEKELYKRVIRRIRELTYREQDDSNNRYTPGIYYPTDAGRCMRQVFFKYKLGITNDISDKGRGRILMSEIVEKIYTEILEEMGYRIHEKFEKEFENIKIRGEVDAVNEDEVVEIKTVTPTSINDVPFVRDIKQLNMYLWLADKENGTLIYVKSDNPSIFKMYHIHFNEQKLLESLRYLQKIHEYIIGNKIPPRTKNKRLCKTCTFREICTKIEELERIRE